MKMKKNNKIPSLPVIPDVISLSDEHQARVRELSAKGFSPQHIVRILPLSRLQQQLMLLRIDTPDDVYQIAYLGGVTERQEAILTSLKNKAVEGDPDAVEAYQKYKQSLQEGELRYKLFGV